jgi:hypothetical protein
MGMRPRYQAALGGTQEDERLFASDLHSCGKARIQVPSELRPREVQLNYSAAKAGACVWFVKSA